MILPALSPLTIASAIEENAIEGVKAWARWPEVEIHEDPAILWTAADIPFFVFNNVLRLRAAPTDTGDSPNRTHAGGENHKSREDMSAGAAIDAPIIAHDDDIVKIDNLFRLRAVDLI